MDSGRILSFERRSFSSKVRLGVMAAVDSLHSQCLIVSAQGYSVSSAPLGRSASSAGVRTPTTRNGGASARDDLTMQRKPDPTRTNFLSAHTSRRPSPLAPLPCNGDLSKRGAMMPPGQSIRVGSSSGQQLSTPGPSGLALRRSLLQAYPAVWMTHPFALVDGVWPNAKPIRRAAQPVPALPPAVEPAPQQLHLMVPPPGIGSAARSEPDAVLRLAPAAACGDVEGDESEGRGEGVARQDHESIARVDEDGAQRQREDVVERPGPLPLTTPELANASHFTTFTAAAAACPPLTAGASQTAAFPPPEAAPRAEVPLPLSVPCAKANPALPPCRQPSPSLPLSRPATPAPLSSRLASPSLPPSRPATPAPLSSRMASPARIEACLGGSAERRRTPARALAVEQQPSRDAPLLQGDIPEAPRVPAVLLALPSDADAAPLPATPSESSPTSPLSEDSVEAGSNPTMPVVPPVDQLPKKELHPLVAALFMPGQARRRSGAPWPLPDLDFRAADAATDRHAGSKRPRAAPQDDPCAPPRPPSLLPAGPEPEEPSVGAFVDEPLPVLPPRVADLLFDFAADSPDRCAWVATSQRARRVDSGLSIGLFPPPLLLHAAAAQVRLEQHPAAAHPLQRGRRRARVVVGAVRLCPPLHSAGPVARMVRPGKAPHAPAEARMPPLPAGTRAYTSPSTTFLTSTPTPSRARPRRSS